MPIEEGKAAPAFTLKDAKGAKVALKELKPGRQDDYPSQRRFVLEAKINGGLEHPGIVPVYGSGSRQCRPAPASPTER